MIAKNYLSEVDIKKLERTVTGFFDYIENVIEREESFTMLEFSKSVNEFLAFNKFEVLEGKGKMSKERAEEKAKSEYDIFNKTQKIESDFDREVKKMLNQENK